MSQRAVRWVCPECLTSIRAEALDTTTAQAVLGDVIREHLDAMHSADRVNAHAQATGWLAAAGHQVELYGGPFDGARLWLPPGERPETIGARRTAGGQVVPVPGRAAARGAAVYRQGEAVAAQAQGRAVRYLFDGRAA